MNALSKKIVFLTLSIFTALSFANAQSTNDIQENVYDGSSFVPTTLSIPSGTDAIAVYDNDNASTIYAALDPIWLFVDSGILKFNIQPIIDSISSTAANAHSEVTAAIASASAALVPVSTAATNAISLASAVSGIVFTHTQRFADIDSNLYATGTSMICTNASTTNCLLPKAQYTKLAGITAPVAYEGTTSRANPIAVFKSATVSSGVAVFNLTTDGTSGGTSLFPNGVIQDSVNVFVSDATASYQMSYAFSNSNKTLTVTANKLTTANILTGLLGQAAATGAVVRLQVYGY